MDFILNSYQQLLEELDTWFADCVSQFPEQLECAKGCSACCRGLFEISLLDAALLQEGFAQLSNSTRKSALKKASTRLASLQQQWPQFVAPYILNRLPHNDWEEMPEDDPTPCPLLSDNGTCLVYQHRPMLCRLHGLPNIDNSGEIFQELFCTRNFLHIDPLQETKLRFPFRAFYRREFELLGQFSSQLLNQRNLELDTFIPTALLIDFRSIKKS